ncbi:PA14 domain-containing protein [Shimia sp. Alg240-R146]|uniref:PA14 domain-containing protein n=1 Tax=Shimia sp. Alg240-R146 TaxID=2993449 RepID=UPI0022E2F547|nr:PA14 domain-containing protein [Shimia sp. Alg240-R146]
MKSFFAKGLAALSLMVAGAVSAAEIEVSPANPQPSGLKSGLKVSYYTGERSVRTVSNAKQRLSKAKPGKPLSGFNYPDKGRGAEVLTSGLAELVVADISGYIKFPAAGTYDLEFFSNDGSEIWIDGKQVAKLNGISPCASAGRPKIKVPSAGWYDFKAVYFQKEGTACLESEWKAPGGKRQLIPNSAFGYK